MKIKFLTCFILSCFFFSCNNDNQTNSTGEAAPKFQNKAHELVYDMAQKVGDYSKLLYKKNVI